MAELGYEGTWDILLRMIRAVKAMIDIFICKLALLKYFIVRDRGFACY